MISTELNKKGMLNMGTATATSLLPPVKGSLTPLPIPPPAPTKITPPTSNVSTNEKEKAKKKFLLFLSDIGYDETDASTKGSYNISKTIELFGVFKEQLNLINLSNVAGKTAKFESIINGLEKQIDGSKLSEQNIIDMIKIVNDMKKGTIYGTNPSNYKIPENDDFSDPLYNPYDDTKTFRINMISLIEQLINYAQEALKKHTIIYDVYTNLNIVYNKTFDEEIKKSSLKTSGAKSMYEFTNKLFTMSNYNIHVFFVAYKNHIKTDLFLNIRNSKNTSFGAPTSSITPPPPPPPPKPRAVEPQV